MSQPKDGEKWERSCVICGHPAAWGSIECGYCKDVQLVLTAFPGPHTQEKIRQLSLERRRNSER